MKKSTKILLIVLALLVVAGIVMYFTGLFDKLGISASTNTPTPTITSKGVITISDGKDIVNPGDELQIKIKLDLNKAKEQNLLGEFRGQQRYNQKIYGYLANGQKTDGRWLVTAPNFVIDVGDIVLHEKVSVAELTVSAKVPQGVTIKNNKIYHKVAIQAGWKGRALVDEAQDTSDIDPNSIADVEITDITFSPEEIDTQSANKTATFTVKYKNTGQGSAKTTVLKFRVPENRFKNFKQTSGTGNFAQLKDTVGGSKYDMLVWQLGDVASNATGTYTVTAEAIPQYEVDASGKQTAIDDRVYLNAEITTVSTEASITNNKKATERGIRLKNANIRDSRSRDRGSL